VAREQKTKDVLIRTPTAKKQHTHKEEHLNKNQQEKKHTESEEEAGTRR